MWRFIKSCVVLSLRTVLFTVMLLLLIAAGLWLLFLKTFNAQHISELITEELQKRLDRPVIISSLDLKFINTVELKGFSVVDTEGAPGYALLSADSVTLQFKLLPLLDQQLIIDEVSLNSPRFNIVRLPDGTYNMPQIRTPKEKSVYTSELTGRKLAVSVEDWSVHNGVLSYKDLASGVSHAIYGLNMHFEQLRFNELSRFQAEMILRNKWGDNISDMEIKGTGHVNFANFDWSKFALRSLRTQVFLFQKPVDLLIDLDNLRTPYFNVKASVPAFASKDLSLFHEKELGFSIPKAQLTAQGKLEQDYRLLTLSQVSVSAADVQAQGSGTLDFTQTPFTADLSAKTNFFKLADKHTYYPDIRQYKLTGQAAVSAQLQRQKGKFSLPLLNVQGKDVSGLFYGFKAEI